MKIDIYDTDSIIDIAPENDRRILRGCLLNGDETWFMLTLFESLKHNPIKVVDVLKIFHNHYVEKGGDGSTWVHHTIDLLKVLPDVEYVRKRIVIGHIQLLSTGSKPRQRDVIRELYAKVESDSREVNPPFMHPDGIEAWFKEKATEYRLPNWKSFKSQYQTYEKKMRK